MYQQLDAQKQHILSDYSTKKSLFTFMDTNNLKYAERQFINHNMEKEL